MVFQVQDSDRIEGGKDLVISFRPDQAEALGLDLLRLGDWLDTFLVGLASIRTGVISMTDPSGKDLGLQPAGPEWWYWVISDLSVRLTPRLEGLLHAAIRQHAEQGGSYGNLATAMDVERSTAQRRRDAITSTNPTVWEKWATKTLS